MKTVSTIPGILWCEKLEKSIGRLRLGMANVRVFPCSRHPSN